MPGDDLTQQLAEAVALQIHWKRRGHDDPANEQPCAGPDDSDREWARAAVAAVLASGLVVPTSDVLNLAGHFADPVEQAAELRALTQTKTEKEN